MGAGAIHQGYGFLSENAAFARAVEAAGIVWIGPAPETIDLMGDKISARRFVAERGFPVAPSVIEDDDPDNFAAHARTVGAPLLIKPSAGGGGKGMRIVRDLDTLEEEIATARSEGERYFGRSEEHTSELQSLMRISYAVFCLKKKTTLLTIRY